MASNMVNSGRSIYEVAKVLGHSQLKTTSDMPMLVSKCYWQRSILRLKPRE
jgi:site-specific recombinase XerD